MKKTQPVDTKFLGETAFIVLGAVRELCMNVKGDIKTEFLLNLINTHFEDEHKRLLAEQSALPRPRKKDYIG